jgi:hypothetical protein
MLPINPPPPLLTYLTRGWEGCGGGHGGRGRVLHEPLGHEREREVQVEAGRGLAPAAVRQRGGRAVARESIYRHPRPQLLALSFLLRLPFLLFLFIFVLLDDGALTDAVSMAHQAFGGGTGAAAPLPLPAFLESYGKRKEFFSPKSRVRYGNRA